MLEWSDKFSTGVPEIDAQHQELFRQVNRLLEACMQGGGKHLLPEIFDFLGKYALEHFATEERYMTRYAYPKLAEHKKVHEDFVQTFLDFRKKAETEGSGVNLVVQVNRTLVDWLKNHILGMDQEMGRFLQGAMGKK